MIHKPVLLKETVDALVSNRNGVYLDGTVGFAGHSYLILNKISTKGKLIGLDSDPYAVEHSNTILSTLKKTFSIHNINFCYFAEILEKLEIDKLDGILLDLGLSSFQIDSEHRGFSYMKNTSLNMKFSNKDLTAKDFLNNSSIEDIAEALKIYGEISQPQLISESIFNQVKKNKMNTTFDLVCSIADVVNNQKLIKVLSQVFQGLRIKINDELNLLERFLKDSIQYLSKKAVIAIITYHSLEDRIVKNYFKQKSQKCICPKEVLLCLCENKPQLRVVQKKPIISTDIELLYNVRSRSAKLRVAEKV